MIIVTIFEVLSVPGAQGDLTFQEFDAAMQGLKAAYQALWKAQDPMPGLEPVGGHIASSSMFNTGAKLEPRYWKCKWKAGFMDECNAVATELRLDVLTIKHAMDGSGNPDKKNNLFATLKQVPAVAHMSEDL